MNLAKRLAKIFSVIFLAYFVASCDKGCVEADEFDREVIEVNSYPINDGVDGVGDTQVAKWHDSGLKTNGEGIVLQVTGAWTPWYGNDDLSSDVQINALPACTFCSMSESSPNCICHTNQTPTSEQDYAGSDCVTNQAAQNDPQKCTCTTAYGSATDYGIYHFPLNKYDKSHNDLKPDYQNPCKYTGGMGLYLGLFGSTGNVIPTRIYHLFSQTEVCDVVRNSSGKCLDDAGNDVTKYIFSSAGDKIFMKNDNDGNFGIDPNTGNDTYHDRNENVKLVILDSRYDDNYGTYKVSFLGGVGVAQDTGLLEFLVHLMEDKVYGAVGADNQRHGGIIETMFNKIVIDSGFVSIVQMAMSFYIITYGISTLIGLADVSKKELMTRSLKIALVIFFTSSTSWYWYNELVVKFFKDGMDSVIAMFMSFSDQNLDPTSGVITAQMNRASLNSSATRFSYADLMIRNMLSVASAKKILGLFFGVPLFGPVYILCIYALIAFFCYVMLMVAMGYVVAIMKLAFVLSLGPIFISFTLSGHTSDMFKKWVAFLGARSLEIIFMFLVLYNFLVLIDQNFASLLSYRACVTQWNLGFFSIPILKSYPHKSLVEWFSAFIMLGGLIFITKLVIDKVPDLAGGLIKIGGEGGGSGAGGFGFDGKSGGGAMVGGIIDRAKSVGGFVGGHVATAAAKAYQGASPIIGSAMSSAGGAMFSAVRSVPGGNAVMDGATKAFNAMPSNPRAMYRNSIIDSAIAEAQKTAASKGLTDDKAEEHIRGAVISKLMSGAKSKSTTIGGAPNASIALGLNLDTITKRMDEKLINKPLADFIKSESAKMKAEGALIGKDFRNELDSRINKWANKKLSGGAESIKDIMADRSAVVNGIRSGGMGLDSMQSLLRKSSEYSAAEAAKVFANKPELQQQYLQHLQDNKFRMDNQRQKTADAVKGTPLQGLHKAAIDIYDTANAVTKFIKPFDNAFGVDSMHDPKRTAESFMRKVSNEESGKKYDSLFNLIRAKTGSWLEYDKGSVLNPANLLKSKADIRQEVKEGNRSGLMNFFAKNQAGKEQEAIKRHYQGKIDDKATAPNHQAKKELEKKMDEKLQDSQERRKFFKDQLEKQATKLGIKDSKEIRSDLEKIKKLESENWQKFFKQSVNKLDEKKNAALDSVRMLAKKNSKKAEEKQRKKISELENLGAMANATELAKEKDKLAKMEANRAEHDKIYKEKYDRRDETGKKNTALEEEKKQALKDIILLKTKSHSLESVVKEINDATRGGPSVAEMAATKSAGDRIDVLKEAYKEKAGIEMEVLKEQLQKEYLAALDKHVGLQRSLLTLNADQNKKIDELLEKNGIDDVVRGKKLQDLMNAHMEKAFPSNPNDAAALSASMSALTAEQKKLIDQHGSIQNIKDGIAEFDGSTLLERAARLAFFERATKESNAVLTNREEDSGPSVVSSDDINIDLGDSNNTRLSTDSHDLAIDDKDDLDKKLDGIRAVTDQIKAGEEVPTSDLLDVVDDLEKHPALDDKKKSKPEEDDGKDKKRKDEDENKAKEDERKAEAEKREVKKNALTVLSDALGSQRDSVNKRLTLENDKTVKSEDKVRELEREINTLDGKISDLRSQISGLG